MTQSEFNKKWKPHQADYTYPVENLENERFESDLDELLKEWAVGFAGNEQPRIAYAKSENELAEIYDTFRDFLLFSDCFINQP